MKRKIQHFGEGKEGAILVPSLKEKTEQRARHWQNEQIEENEVKSIRTIVLKRFNYLTIGRQSIGFQIQIIHEH